MKFPTLGRDRRHTASLLLFRNEAITTRRSRGSTYRRASSERPTNSHKAYKGCVPMYFEIAVIRFQQKVVVNQ
jgi:hypothetical protein